MRVATLRITLSYDGADFAGWQVQEGRRTVQGVLEAAWNEITGEAVRVTASGRTDAGVHALGQVVSLRTGTHLSPDVLQRALNARLPADVVVRSVEPAPDGFHAIRDAQAKRYRYVIHDGPLADVFLRRFVWKVWDRLDEQAMQRAAPALVGSHDFRSFQTAGAPRKTTVRTVSELSVCRIPCREEIPSRAGVSPSAATDDSLRPEGRTTETRSAGFSPSSSDVIVVEIESDGFLYNMVRAIVGALVEVGRGARTEAWPAEVLAACDRRAGGPTAPPQGLFLVSVRYPETPPLLQATAAEFDTLALHIDGWTGRTPVEQSICLAVIRGRRYVPHIAAYLGLSSESIESALSKLIGNGLLWSNAKLVLQ